MQYDVVIIGAGSAGCVLATRLTEDPQRSVLLLEVGPDYTDLERYPDDLKYGYDQTASAVDAPHNWSFVGTPTPQQGASMPVPRGRVVGGSSAINGQVFLRGVPEDYDNWAALGNDAWTFRQVLPYFRKAETDTDIRDDLHGSDGPIPVRRHKPETWLPAQTAFYEACLAADFPADPDMNHPDSMGVGPIPMNNPDGIRMSTALTYLNPIRHRLNLTVKAHVLVRRLLFAGKKVTGVEVDSGGERFSVEAGEVILTAGAIASPQLLMLSGVGPAEHLRSLGIPVRACLTRGRAKLARPSECAGPGEGQRRLSPRPQGAQDAARPALHRPGLQRPQRHANPAVVLFLADRRRPAGGGGHSLHLHSGAGGRRR